MSHAPFGNTLWMLALQCDLRGVFAALFVPVMGR